MVHDTKLPYIPSARTIAGVGYFTHCGSGFSATGLRNRIYVEKSAPTAADFAADFTYGKIHSKILTVQLLTC